MSQNQNGISVGISSGFSVVFFSIELGPRVADNAHLSSSIPSSSATTTKVRSPGTAHDPSLGDVLVSNLKAPPSDLVSSFCIQRVSHSHFNDRFEGAVVLLHRLGPWPLLADFQLEIHKGAAAAATETLSGAAIWLPPAVPLHFCGVLARPLASLPARVGEKIILKRFFSTGNCILR